MNGTLRECAMKAKKHAGLEVPEVRGRLKFECMACPAPPQQWIANLLMPCPHCGSTSIRVLTRYPLLRFVDRVHGGDAR